MKKKVCIYGAGAIGLDLALHFILAGHKPTIIARGENLKVLSQGIQHRNFQGKPLKILPEQYYLSTIDNLTDTFDFVFLTVKVEALLELSINLSKLCNKTTCIVSATNGIPPWYSYLQANSIGRFPINTKPRETFLKNIDPNYLLGAIVDRAVELSSSGEILTSSGKGLRIGELNHLVSERVKDLVSLLNSIGYSSSISDNIHRDIWLKLIGNVALNPLSVLEEKTAGEIIAQVDLIERVEKITREAELVGLKLGVIQAGDFIFERFLKFVKTNLSQHNSSMLQDFRKGKPLELHRILEVVILFGELVGVNLHLPEIKKLEQDVKNKLKTC